MPITPAHLEGLTTFEQLAKLFADELGWPRPDWPTFRHVAALYDLTAGDIPGVESLAAVEKLDDDQTWGIFLVDFGPNVLQRRSLRKILSKIADRARQDHALQTWPKEQILFIIRHSGGAFSFGNYSGGTVTGAKLQTFGWDNPRHSRTVCTLNLPALAWDLQSKWNQAWSIKALTNEFFTTFRQIFEEYAPQSWIVKGNQHDAKRHPIASRDEQTLFLQRVTNRLLFIAFLQEKGWLKTDGLPRRDYLYDLYDRWRADRKGLFYNQLYRLFFNGLNEPDPEKRALLEPEFGSMPFLNGGLFHRERYEVEDSVDGLAFAPDALFDRLLGEDGLFRSYNFTAVENYDETDQEIAIDPEMLGRIFEELVTDRHDGGSYYTPRPIVAYMCREGLKGYLETEGIEPGTAAKLVDDQDPSGLAHAQFTPAIQALARVKVLDPACGSGAYVVGMLHELMGLIGILEHRLDPLLARDEYNRKLAIIQNCLYGVDLKPFATNIARLRLWLSLLVDFNDPGDPPPLPNLAFKIASGDSLLGAAPNTMGQFHAHEQTLIDIDGLKADFMRQHPPESDATEAKIRNLIETVKQFDPPSPADNAFSWRAEFGEVFIGDRADRPGFDIIVANPPYVRHELIKESKPSLKQVYGPFYSGTADLYTFFYARAVQLLRDGGMLAFISSKQWLRAAYGKNLRQLMAQATRIRSIIDFGELPVFNAATFPMIIIAQKGTPQAQAPTFTQVKTLAPPYPDVKALVMASGFALPPDAIRDHDWTLSNRATLDRLRTMEASGTTLGEYVKGQIYRGILTGFNEAFVIDGARRAALIAEDPKSAEIIKPLAVGDDVRKWRIRKRDVWLIFTRRGINIDAYPAIKNHLEGFRKGLEPRPADWEERQKARKAKGLQEEKWPGRKPGSYKWFEIQDDIAYYAKFDKPKVIYPVIGKEPRFAYDSQGAFTNDKAFIIPVASLFLAGVLNSASAWTWLQVVCSALGDADDGGRLELRSVYMERLPIPRASAADRAAIEALVQQILDLKSADPAADVSEFEAEIDKRVDFLYFKQHEAPTYDEWVAKREAEKGTIIEEVRQLLAVGHETVNLECKSTFAWDVKKNEQGDYLKDEVHTAICALLNAQGGDLLIGVEELDNNILRVRGLAEDLRRYGGKDGLLSAIEQPLGKTLYPNPIGHVDIKAVDIDGETIVRVHVTPDRTERYRFKEQIYVRRNTKSKPPLTADEAAIWWPKRQRGEV